MLENWSWALRARGRTIPIPALMVTAGKDPVLKPGLSKGMEAWIPRLQRGHIQDCGHWTQLERPLELNRSSCSGCSSSRSRPGIPNFEPEVFQEFPQEFQAWSGNFSWEFQTLSRNFFPGNFPGIFPRNSKFSCQFFHEFFCGIPNFESEFFLEFLRIFSGNSKL
ncbi:bifunctional epoxide hydrolase 2-like [Camarhynchus parvulus]|uniref:bifunctional epoxide hydrolase 2-like n=1 Tax=Geospiza parvula TaxID=87175 RepID=UPI001237F29A|nr:bifunctional epoxide hydrolase 2-like [Camarhynchus parvulus]